MVIKKHDFVEIEYTGSLKDDGMVFDTTDEKVAKEKGIFNQQTEYGPITVCVGKAQVLEGIDKNIEGKEPGEYEFTLSPEDAFGKKDAKLIQLIPTKKFIQQKIQPMPGLQINIDGTIGTIKTVAGGRTIVDFNHPLSGKEVNYKLKVNKIVTDKAEQIASFIKLLIGGMKAPKVTVSGDEAKVILKGELPKELQEKISEEIKEVVDIKTITYAKEEKKEKKEGKEEKAE